MHDFEFSNFGSLNYPVLTLYKWTHIETGTWGTRVIRTRTENYARELIDHWNELSNDYYYLVVFSNR